MNDKDTAAQLSFLRLLPSIIVVLLAALAIPFASELHVGAAASSICAIFLIATAKKKIPVLLMLLLLIGTLGIPNGLPMITVILALIVGSGAYSWLISYTRSPYVAIIPVLAYSIATVLTKNWFGSLVALAFVPSAIALATSFKSGATRLGAICKSSGAFAITAALAIIFAMLYFRGEIRLDILKGYADSFTQSIADVFASTEMELINGETEALFSEEDAYMLARRIVTLFPAIAVVFLNSISFFAQRLQFRLLRATLGEDVLGSRAIAFIVSPVAGAVYVISFLVATLTNSSPLDRIVNTVCQNLFVILSPALIGMGIIFFFAKMAVKQIRFAPLIIVAVIVLTIFNTQAALLLVACFGAYASIAIPILSYLKEKSGKE